MAKKVDDTTTSKELTKVTGAENVPAMVDFSEFDGDNDARMGADMSIPFLSILQPLSPVVVDELVPGAKAGMFYNSVTGELFDGSKGVGFLVCTSDRKFVEWAPRETGEGLLGMHEPGAPEVEQAIKENGGKADKDLNLGGNPLVDTRYVYGLVYNADFTELKGFAVLAAKSTNLKPVRDWLTARAMVKVPGVRSIPDYAFRSILKTVKDSNEQGTWFKLKVEPFGGTWLASVNMTDRDMLTSGKEFRKMVVEGRAKADFSQEKASTAAAGGDGGAVPF